MKEKRSQPVDVYATVNNRIIKFLEKQKVPWQCTWGKAGIPKNLITGKPYRGINIWLLVQLEFEQNSFLTSKQIKEIGATIKEGEKGNIVVYWKWLEVKDDETEQIVNVPFLRYNYVYNVAQCNGIADSYISIINVDNGNSTKFCETILEQMPNKPKIKNDEMQTYYNPLIDSVNIPKVETFESMEHYFCALFPELIHSTGHQSRLNRKEILQQKVFGSDAFSIEELVAELGTCYLKSFSGMSKEHFHNNGIDTKGWLEKIRKDKRALVYASTLAQKATDYILNVTYQFNEIQPESESTIEKLEEEINDDMPF